jgi:hypothetical protein
MHWREDDGDDVWLRGCREAFVKGEDRRDEGLPFALREREKERGRDGGDVRGEVVEYLTVG